MSLDEVGAARDALVRVTKGTLSCTLIGAAYGYLVRHSDLIPARSVLRHAVYLTIFGSPVFLLREGLVYARGKEDVLNSALSGSLAGMFYSRLFTGGTKGMLQAGLFMGGLGTVLHVLVVGLVRVWPWTRAHAGPLLATDEARGSDGAQKSLWTRMLEYEGTAAYLARKRAHLEHKELMALEATLEEKKKYYHELKSELLAQPSSASPIE